MMNISVKNISTVVTDSEVQAALPDFQIQLDRDFGPAWDLAAKLSFLPVTSPVPADHALLLVCDDADQPGALGYHDLQPNGQPIGKVFAKTTITYGGKWTVTFSHELLEMVVDPLINLMALDDQRGRFYAYEVCDAVEDDTLGYLINQTLVSDFVLPHWFDEHSKRHHIQFSFRSHVSAPFALAHGGYISYLDLATGQWKQITAQLAPFTDGRVHSTNDLAKKAHDAVARPGSRRERRQRGRENWIHSVI
jgi:hypothetical protein